jgi:hypothetical protein
MVIMENWSWAFGFGGGVLMTFLYFKLAFKIHLRNKKVTITDKKPMDEAEAKRLEDEMFGDIRKANSRIKNTDHADLSKATTRANDVTEPFEGNSDIPDEDPILIEITKEERIELAKELADRMKNTVFMTAEHASRKWFQTVTHLKYIRPDNTYTFPYNMVFVGTDLLEIVGGIRREREAINGRDS